MNDKISPQMFNVLGVIKMRMSERATSGQSKNLSRE